MTEGPTPQWRKIAGADGSGVEVAELDDGMIAVRDANDPDGTVLRFTRREIEAFLLGAKAGEFDDLSDTATG